MKRLNWVDILIIVILVGAVAFLGIRTLGKTGDKQTAGDSSQNVEQNPLTEPKLRMVVEVPEISREIVENAVASFENAPRKLDGDMIPMTRLYNSNRLVDGRVVSWEIIDTEDEDMVCVRFTIEANPSVYRCNYSVGNQEVRIGKSYIVKTMSMEITGTIVSVTELAPITGTELDNE